MKQNTVFRHVPAGWSWVTLCGPDARDFLHRLTTADVKGLEIGQGAPACFLTAQGRIRAYFQLWRYGPEDFAFEFDPGEANSGKTSLLSIIDEYTFGEKIALADVTALSSVWVLADKSKESELFQTLGAPGLSARSTLATGEEIRICHHGEADFGKVWLSLWGRPERLKQWTDRVLADAAPIGVPELEGLRIHSLRPRAGREITDAVSPLEIGLTDAIAQQKGCYPGQEVIERILSMGSPPQRLALIEGEGEVPSPGNPLFNQASPPGEIGRLTSALADEAHPGRFLALALIRKIAAKEDLEVSVGPLGPKARIKRVSPYA